jgi:serine/threonine-protein kinase
MPPGYVADACAPTTDALGTMTSIACGQSSDPQGPTSATFAVVDDEATLHAAFEQLI